MSNKSHRKELVGFVVPGILLGLPGSLVISWQYHVVADARLIGLHFLAPNLGYLVAAFLAQRWNIALRWLWTLGIVIAVLSLATLPFVRPPATDSLRLLALFVAGCAAGLLTTGVLNSYGGSTGGAMRAGALFGGGSCFATVVVGIGYAKGWPQAPLILPALALLLFAVRIQGWRSPAPTEPVHTHRLAAVLFSLLIFFQFGSEWAIADWLPTFLARKLGANPAMAIFDLAIYFVLLVAGRWLAQFFLPVVSHRRLLLLSIVCAMIGYLLLGISHSASEAYTGIVIVGLSFGPIYPLLLENLQNRFPYRPGFYNGIFSVGVAGAMLAPWLLGFVCHALGIGWAMLIPALGSIAVLILALLLLLEARLMRPAPTAPGQLLY